MNTWRGVNTCCHCVSKGRATHTRDRGSGQVQQAAWRHDTWQLEELQRVVRRAIPPSRPWRNVKMDTDPCLPPLFLISHSSPKLTSRAPIIPAVLPLNLDLAWDIGIGLVHGYACSKCKCAIAPGIAICFNSKAYFL